MMRLYALEEKPSGFRTASVATLSPAGGPCSGKGVRAGRDASKKNWNRMSRYEPLSKMSGGVKLDDGIKQIKSAAWPGIHTS